MGQSKQRRRYPPPIDACALALIASLLAAPPAGADPIPPALTAAELPATLDLQLDVLIDDQPAHVIGAFTLLPGNQLAARRSELTAIGLKIAADGPGDELLTLAAIPGLAYSYDARRQAVDFHVDAGLRRPRTYEAQGATERPAARSSTGLVVNYSAYAAGSENLKAFRGEIDGGSLSLDARAFSPYGTLSQSGIVGTTTFSKATTLRLDTILAVDDDEHARSYRAGDFINGGLPWTRPVRMGGLQLRRNFDLRPDLVTIPLPSVSGSAAVPSTIDVYINNIRSYSQQVEGGPFQIDNLPATTGSSETRVVMTDATGRQTEQQSEFFTSPDLLRKGLYDYSAEAGFLRRGYGTRSFDYDDRPAATASLRYGLTDRLTIEGHGEGGSRLQNAGAGATFGAARFGQIDGAVAASHTPGKTGAMLFAGWERQFGRLSLNASLRRQLGGYRDLASSSPAGLAIPAKGRFIQASTAREIDQISLGYGFPEQDAGIGLSLVHLANGDGDHDFITSGSITKSFANDMSVYASGFWETGKDRAYGAFAGLSIPLGKKTNAWTSANLDNGHLTAAATIARSMDGTPGSYGWQVTHAEGDTSATTANAAYRASDALLQAEAWQNASNGGASLSADGAVVLAGGGLFLGNRIDDAFAVVDAGAPGIPVKLDNRDAGSTGSSGKLLVTGLKAYQNNKLSIDVATLPVTASVPKTETIAVPKAGSGLTVDFGIKPDQASAIVTLTDAAGSPLPVGTAVTLEGSSDPFVVGFDGEVYLTGLGASNAIDSTAGTVACSARFTFKPAAGQQQQIGPLKCT